MGELEPAVATDPETDVGQTCPGIVVASKQHRRDHRLAVAHPKCLRRRAGQVLLDVLEVNVVGRMPAGALPVLENMRVAVNDHRPTRPCDARDASRPKTRTASSSPWPRATRGAAAPILLLRAKSPSPSRAPAAVAPWYRVKASLAKRRAQHRRSPSITRRRASPCGNGTGARSRH